MKTLGVVGGIGPESTIEYYRLLVSGHHMRDPDGRSPSIVIHSVDVGEVLALAAARELGRLADYLAASVARLARAGADLALLSSNTAHVVFGEVARRSPIPMISIVDATCAVARRRRLRRLALFGTRATMQSRIYEDVFEPQGIEIVLPDAGEQDDVHEKYVGELVQGRFLPETRARLLAIVGLLRERERIDGVILGGTELPLLLRDDAIDGVPLLDTTRIHVTAALDAMFAR